MIKDGQKSVEAHPQEMIFLRAFFKFSFDTRSFVGN